MVRPHGKDGCRTTCKDNRTVPSTQERRKTTTEMGELREEGLKISGEGERWREGAVDSVLRR